jgi:cytochrome b6-f complex iron-sulfur subunit
MERRKFIVQTATPFLAFCAACSKSGNSTSSSNVDFAIDITNTITAPGNSITRDGVIVVRINAQNTISSFIAFQVECTHAANPIVWNQSAQQFNCNLHGSVFSITGAVINGPANRPLKAFNLSLTGNNLRVTG